MEDNLKDWISTKALTSTGQINSNIYKDESFHIHKKALYDLYPLYTSLPLKEIVFLYLNNLHSPTLCTCGKPLKFKSIKKGYSKYCSIKCSANDPKVKESIKFKNKKCMQQIVEKRKETNLKRYGSSTPLQNSEIKERIRLSNIEKFGSENPMQNESIVKKAQSTNIDKYGCNTPILDNKEVALKRASTMIEKYGSVHALQNTSIQDKAKATTKMIYGEEYALRNPDILDSMISTLSSRYGVTNVSNIPEVITLKRETRLKSFYKTLLSGERTSLRVEPLFLLEDYDGVEGKKYNWRCKECSTEFSDHIEDGHTPRCPKCYPYESSSLMQKEIEHYLSSYTIVEANNRSILPSGKEIDIYLPEHNMGVEFNGEYWHTESKGRDKNYHINKTVEANSCGIDLIQIFEWEWLSKKDVIKSIILNRINIAKKVFARKLSVKLVPVSQERGFLDHNHIQGYIPSKVCIGLYEGDALLQLISFGKPRFSKSYEWELLRLCTAENYSITGGFSRLLHHFIRDCSPSSILTYCDMRYFNGKGYEKIGFKLSHRSEPSYVYIKNHKIYSRYNFQKHLLREKLECYNENLTEWENMKLNGYDRIWDCGTKVYTLTP